MARGTKLYQQPRSPLIQGHSKTEQPVWREWLKGIALGAAFTGVLFAIYSILVPGTAFSIGGLSTTGVVAGVLGGTLISLGPAVVAALLGVLLARRMGWRRQWFVGMLLTPLVLAVMAAFMSTNGVLGVLTLG